MTDTEISKALALAIGWTEDRLDENGLPDPDAAIFGFGINHHRPEPDEVKCWDGDIWRTFDHRDPVIAFRVAERYNKFPYMHRGKDGLLDGKWVVWPDTLADTPQDAIALSVINGEKE